MPTYTTTYSLGKPVVGADEDAWGDTLNASLDSIDDILDGTTPVTGIDINSGTIDNVVIGGATPAAGTFTTLTANTSITGTLATAAQPNVTSLGTLTSLTVSGDVSFGDSDKAIFGAGSDLQIYHDGVDTYITESGVGSLIIKGNFLQLQSPTGEMFIDNVANGAVTLYHNNNTKLATTSTGIDVTGTVTADGLTVDGDGGLVTSDGAILKLENSSTALTNGSVVGDLQFYANDTSTNATGAKAFIKATSETSGGTNIGLTLATSDSTSATGLSRIRIDADGDISFYEDTGTTAKFFWDASAESLGIGTSSPFYPLSVRNTAFATVAEFRTIDGTNNPGLEIKTSASGTTLAQVYSSGASANLILETNNTERMRIDSSGNLLVGQTSADDNTVGIGLVGSTGAMYAVRSGGRALYLNRKTSDGSILDFAKDGTTVGSIGTASGYLTTGNADTGLIFHGGVDRIYPWNTSTNASRDNAIDLGTSGARFDDIYATNGTIQTSDANEKQDIAELSEAEQRVAVAAKGLLRKFRWKDAVAEKGDEARTHFGIIAQDLQAAFVAEGLDAGDYAMFIHTTWTDEETGEERSRMGVRYSELLAFIIAAI